MVTFIKADTQKLKEYTYDLKEFFPLSRAFLQTESYTNDEEVQWYQVIDEETGITCAIFALTKKEDRHGIIELVCLEVKKSWRNSGIGTFILRELKASYNHLRIVSSPSASSFYKKSGLKLLNNIENIFEWERSE